MSLVHWEEKFESCVQVPKLKRYLSNPELIDSSGDLCKIVSRTQISVVHILISNTWMSARDFVEADPLPSFLANYAIFGSSSCGEIDTGDELLVRREVIWGPIKNAKEEWVCRIRCTYDENDMTDHGSTTPRAPTLDDPITITQSWVERTIPLRVDLNGRRVVNTVEQEFFDPVTVTRYDPIWSITRREFRNPKSITDEFEGKINEDEIWGCEARSLRINTIETSFSSENFGWQVTYNIEQNRDGWDLKPLNLGTRERRQGNGSEDSSSGWGKDSYREILDEKGQPISDPVLLSQEGTQTDTPYYFEYDPFVGYESADFSRLTIPDLSELL